MGYLKTARWGVQAAFVGLCLWVGFDFFRFYAQVVAGGAVTVQRPAGVEAFLPISALLGLKRWVLTGLWDDIHPAGLTLLVAFIIGAAVARRAFCSWICPIGTLSRGLEWLRRVVFRLPPRWGGPMWLRYLAELPKYGVLFAFLWFIGSMSLAEIEQFMHMPYNLGADASLLLMFANLSTTGIMIFGGLVVLSIVVRNGWCRILCPYGALLALFGVLSPFRIRRNADACVQCGQCTKACGMGIRVAEKAVVQSLECTACLSCVASCRVAGALEVKSAWGGRVKPWLVPAAALAVLLAAYLLAQATGHWSANFLPADYRFPFMFGGHSH